MTTSSLLPPHRSTLAPPWMSHKLSLPISSLCPCLPCSSSPSQPGWCCCSRCSGCSQLPAGGCWRACGVDSLAAFWCPREESGPGCRPSGIRAGLWVGARAVRGPPLCEPGSRTLLCAHGGGCSPASPSLHLFPCVWPVSLLLSSAARGAWDPAGVKVTRPPLHSFSPSPLWGASDSRDSDVCARPHGDCTFGFACLPPPPPCSPPRPIQGLRRGKVSKNLRPSSHREGVAAPWGPPGRAASAAGVRLPAPWKQPLRM